MRHSHIIILNIIIWQGKSEHSDWFFLGRDFAIQIVSVEMVISCVIFLLSKAGKFKTSKAWVPYNKLLTILASSSRTRGYWPSVPFVWTSLHSVCTATTSGQYSLVWPSHLVSKTLLLAKGWSKYYISKLAYLQKSKIKTSSNQGLWECIRRRHFNIYTLIKWMVSLADFQPLSVAKTSVFHRQPRFYRCNNHSVNVHARAMIC